MVYLYLPPRKYNMNALNFYMEILEEAFENNGERVKRISNLHSVIKGDKVIVITVNDCARVLLKKRGVKIYTWYQGIAPEEMAFNAKGINKIFEYLKWSICDILSLWGSTGNIYVSEAMAKHYKKKYAFFKNNFTIMPCFNQELEEDAFLQAKYDSPSFVYSGSVAKWQCFEQTIDAFVAIRKALPKAKLSVFTNMIEQAKEIVENAGLNNIEIRNVPYQELPAEMKKFKYGFLIRNNHALNRVATPTKMSTYLGCGIIPIFSPVIGDFNKRLGNLHYIVNAESISQLVQKIKELELTPINSANILNEYQKVFKDYYCRDKYVKQISDFFAKYN